MTTSTNVVSKSGLATASLVLGILAAISAIFASGIGFLLGLAAVILGALALRDIKAKGLQGKGWAIVGILLGALGVIWVFVVLFVLGPILANTFSTINASLNSVGP